VGADGLVASGLEHSETGWRPRFDVEVMAQTLREAISVPSWDEWDSIRCPTLVVRAGNGMVEPETASPRTMPLIAPCPAPSEPSALHAVPPLQWAT